ncbi:MAG: hypothetical protein GXO20_01495 [Thermodesulfobacteria bacterium]|nr:hypothetical protein [Thermodesulfobacteriota bacterium]
MRQTFLLLFLIIAGCALPHPTKWQPSLSPFSGAKGRLFFEVSTPRGKFEGESFFVAGRSFFYLEGLSPFGFALFQGLLEDQEAQLVLFPKREAYLLRFHLPEEVAGAWGELLLGRLPASFLQEALLFETKNFYLLKKEAGAFRILAKFSKEGVLKEVTVKKERTLLRLSYRGSKEVLWEVPPVRSRGRLVFETVNFVEDPRKPTLVIPRGFKRFSWELKW